VPRRLKPKEVGRITVPKYNISVPLLLDRESLDFFVEFQGRSVSAKTAEEAKTLGRDLIINTIALEWQSVIEVSLDEYANERDQSGRLDFDFERFLVATAPWMTEGERSRSQPRGLRRDWPPARGAHPLTKEGYERGADIKVDFMAGRRDGIFRLPYSDETWAGLVRLAKIVRQARRALKKLLGQKDAAALLAGMPFDRPLLLPASADDEEEKED